ncbi:MAG: acyl-CoA synthetase [Rhizobiales bacterium]|nr:acyl-CoA synthetase [Hyphomicrobiales bacterium]
MQNTAGTPSQSSTETPERFNIAAYAVGRMAAAKPDNLALAVYDGKGTEPTDVWNYAALEDAVLRTTTGLQSAGFKMGDRILLRMGNSVWFPVMFFACLAGGFVPVPTSDKLAPDVLEHIARDCRPVAIAHDGVTPLPVNQSGASIFGPNELDLLMRSPLGLYARTLSYDPAYLIYTDGTTAPPRGVLHAHRALWGRLEMQKEWMDLKDGDRILHRGADDWSKAIGYGLMDPFCHGATCLLISTPELRSVFAKALPILAELTGATIIKATPDDYRIALASGGVSKQALPKVRHCLAGGSILPEEVAIEWYAAMGLPLLDGYELTEIACPVYSGKQCVDKPGTMGKPGSNRRFGVLAPDAGLKNLPVNKIGIMSVHRTDPALMLGYWNDATATKASVRGAWFLTGDLGRRDQDSYVQYEGRLESLLNLDGYRSNPEEIETVLRKLPGILDAAVAEGLVPGRGSHALIAYIVAEPGFELVHTELNRAVAPLLVDYKRPKKWIEVDGLPKTANGRIARYALKLALAG